METFSKKVESWLMATSKLSLLELCKHFKYPATETKIMEINAADEKQGRAIVARNADIKALYLQASKDSRFIARKGANRNWTQYFQDLITGWVLEDLMVARLRKQGLEVIHNGWDAARKIIADDVTQDADLEIKVGDNVRKVELVCEFNPILERDGYIEKRTPALRKLWENKCIWVYMDLPSAKYVLIDFAVEPIVSKLRYHAKWDKDVNRYVLADNNKKIRDDKMLIAELVSVVGCGIEGKKQPDFIEVEDKDSPPKKHRAIPVTHSDKAGIAPEGKSKQPESIKVTTTAPNKQPIEPKLEPPKQSNPVLVTPKPKVVAVQPPPSPPKPVPIMQEVQEYEENDVGDGWEADSFESTADADYGDADFV